MLGVQGRDHLEFVVRLKDRLPCRATLADQLCGSLEAAGFQLQVGWAADRLPHALRSGSGPAYGAADTIAGKPPLQAQHAYSVAGFSHIWSAGG